jgi:hypothetical protein
MVAISLVASFGNSAPVWNTASPESFSVASRAVPAAASPSRNVYVFFGVGNAPSNVDCARLTWSSIAIVCGGS